MDGRLGDAFFHLAAIVHGQIYVYDRQKLSSEEIMDDIEPVQQRRYQTKQVANDEKGKEISLIQFAPSGESDSYFSNYCHRINSAGWRYPVSFPSHVSAISVNLSRAYLFGAYLFGAYLFGAYLFEAYLFEAYLSRANLSRADLSRAKLLGANLSGARLFGADLLGANLFGADLSRANLLGANLLGANLLGANLLGANLLGANLLGADFTGADLSGADFRRAKNLLIEQIKKARNWDFAQYDPEIRERLY